MLAAGAAARGVGVLLSKRTLYTRSGLACFDVVLCTVWSIRSPGRVQQTSRCTGFCVASCSLHAAACCAVLQAHLAAMQQRTMLVDPVGCMVGVWNRQDDVAAAWWGITGAFRVGTVPHAHEQEVMLVA